MHHLPLTQNTSYISPHEVYLCVSYDSHNKQLLYAYKR